VILPILLFVLPVLLDHPLNLERSVRHVALVRYPLRVVRVVHALLDLVILVLRIPAMLVLPALVL